MRFAPLFAVTALLLTACNSTQLQYNLTFDTTDEERQTQLMEASLRVVERRAASLETEADKLDIDVTDEGATISFELADEGATEALAANMQAPFTLQIMREAPAETAEITIEGHGGFAGTGITEEDIDWVESGETPSGQGRINLIFTEAGRVTLERIMAENIGKNVGLFVRDRLIAKLLVNEEIQEYIVISGIPSVELAEIFADDVNVGLHVTFNPVP